MHLYNNAKLQGFLALRIPENSGYVFNQEHPTEMNITKLL